MWVCCVCLFLCICSRMSELRCIWPRWESSGRWCTQSSWYVMLMPHSVHPIKHNLLNASILLPLSLCTSSNNHIAHVHLNCCNSKYINYKIKEVASTIAIVVHRLLSILFTDITNNLKVPIVFRFVTCLYRLFWFVPVLITKSHTLFLRKCFFHKLP